MATDAGLAGTKFTPKKPKLPPGPKSPAEVAEEAQRLVRRTEKWASMEKWIFRFCKTTPLRRSGSSGL